MPAASTDQRNRHHHHSSPKFGAHTHTHTTPSECAQPPCHVHVELIRTTQQHNATTVCGSLTNQPQHSLTVTPSKPRQELVGYRMHVGEKSRSRGYTQGECSGVRRWWAGQGRVKYPHVPIDDRSHASLTARPGLSTPTAPPTPSTHDRHS